MTTLSTGTPLTITDICEAINTTLSAAPSLVQAQTGNDIGEAIADTPTLQVYWDEWEMSAGSGTAQASFGGGIRIKKHVINADLYITQRTSIGENMTVLQRVVDEFIDLFEAQEHPPYFGLTGIKSWKPRNAKRVIFDYSTEKLLGVRIPIEIVLF